MSSSSTDRVVRAMTIDGAFRVIATIVTDTANAACAAQGLAPDLTSKLAELLACAVLVRETTQPTRRVQLVWRDHFGGVMVADSLPDGKSRGIVNPGKPQEVTATGEHLLQVNYTLPNGTLHQGVVSIPADSDLSTALMQYMHTSEQTVSMVAIGAVPGQGDGAVKQVGGYLIQVLPEATREGIEELSKKLAVMPSIDTLVADAETDPRAIIARLLEGFPYAQLADSGLTFGCTCSEARIILGILSLGADEVAAMEAGDPLEVRCDACGTRYVIEPASIRAMRELRARGQAPS